MFHKCYIVRSFMVGGLHKRCVSLEEGYLREVISFRGESVPESFSRGDQSDSESLFKVFSHYRSILFESGDIWEP